MQIYNKEKMISNIKCYNNVYFFSRSLKKMVYHGLSIIPESNALQKVMPYIALFTMICVPELIIAGQEIYFSFYFFKRQKFCFIFLFDHIFCSESCFH